MSPDATVWVFGDGALATATARGLAALGVPVRRVGQVQSAGPWTWTATAPRAHAAEACHTVVVEEHTAALLARCDELQASGRQVGLTVAPIHARPAAPGPHLAVGAVWGPDTPWIVQLSDAIARRPHGLWLPNLGGLRPTTPHVLAQAILARLATPSDAAWTLNGATPHRLHELGELILRHAGHSTLRPRTTPAWATALRYGLRTATLREWVAAASVDRHTPGWQADEIETRWDWVAPRTRTRRGPP